MTAPEFALVGYTLEGRKFIIFPDKNRMEWCKTDEIGPIGIPIKNEVSHDLFRALKNGLPINEYLAV
jgi:hypothetical protein